MSDIQKISVTLSAEQLATIKEAVASGAYASTSEVIRDALRRWELREPLRQAEIERLRALWQEGIESGTPKPYSLEEVLQGGERRLKEFRQRRKSA